MSAKQPAHTVIIDELRKLRDGHNKISVGIIPAQIVCEKAKMLAEMLGKIPIPKDERDTVTGVVITCSHMYNGHLDVDKLINEILEEKKDEEKENSPKSPLGINLDMAEEAKSFWAEAIEWAREQKEKIRNMAGRDLPPGFDPDDEHKYTFKL